MLITVSHSDESVQKFEIENFPIIIGRGTDCDVVIASDHISRKHLEIQNRDGQIFIRDLTLSNWVSYNDEKLSKSEYIQYFDFAPLVLPSGHEINFETSESEGLQIQGSADGADGAVGKVDIYESKVSTVERNILEVDKKVSKSKVRHTKVKNESKSQKQILFVSLSLLVLGYFAYGYIQKNILRTQKVEEFEIKAPAVEEINLSLLQKMLNTKKCQTAVVRPLCDSVLPNWKGKEGVVEYQKELFVFKNLNVRLSTIVKDNKTLTESREFLKVVAAQRVLVPNFLAALNKRLIKKMYVVLFEPQKDSSNIKNIYVMDTSIYTQLTQETYKNAYLAIIKKGDMSIFNNKMSGLLTEKMDM